MNAVLENKKTLRMKGLLFWWRQRGSTSCFAGDGAATQPDGFGTRLATSCAKAFPERFFVRKKPYGSRPASCFYENKKTLRVEGLFVLVEAEGLEPTTLRM